MDKITQVVNALLDLLVRLGDIVLAALASIETWLRNQLSGMGVDPRVQTIILLAVALILLLAVLRLFGGVLRAILVIVLVLLALHVLLPIVQSP